METDRQDIDNAGLDRIAELAAGIARRTGSLIKDSAGNAGKTFYKGAVDLVTEMDREAEELIISLIQERYPDHGILTEERAELTSDSVCRWIVDPIDGTTNYSHGFPVYCVSIAFELEGEVVIGVVYDPTRDELFTARKGKGACLNGDPISVSKTGTLDRSLLATGFPYDIRSSKENNLTEFGRFAVRAQAIRRAGSAAIDLCYVGCGRFDGFWEMKLHAWDIAAAALVVTEAGGLVTDYEGLPSTIHNKRLLASNGAIHNEMIIVLKGD